MQINGPILRQAISLGHSLLPVSLLKQLAATIDATRAISDITDSHNEIKITPGEELKRSLQEAVFSMNVPDDADTSKILLTGHKQGVSR